MDSHHHSLQQHEDDHHQILSPTTFNINKDGGAYDLAELDQALFQYLDVQHPSPQQQRQNCGMRPQHTLNIFPSQPMHVEPSETASKGNGGLVCASGSKISSEPSPSHQTSDASSAPLGPAKVVYKREGNRKGPTSSSEQETKTSHDPKTLRRLAQNREAARKSRLRKKAYVQQLESSRMRLAHLEQEMQRARSQGVYLGGSGLISAGDPSQLSVAMMANINNASSDAALFDMEYTRWVEEHNHHTVELRRAVDDQLPEHGLRMLVDNHLAHYDQLINLKSAVLKSDVFHIFSGAWRTPAERCFLWMGGFRPSHLIKMISSQVEALSDEQLMGVYALQQSTQEAEEALSHGIEALNQSITQTLIANSADSLPNMTTYTPHMALAINNLSALEGFIRQADNLRQQSLHRVRQILSSRQSARCFLAIAEYFHRLRALSSLWLGRSHQE